MRPQEWKGEDFLSLALLLRNSVEPTIFEGVLDHQVVNIFYSIWSEVF